MKINLTPIELIDQLRSWFHPKDRVVVMSTTLTAAILPGGSTLAMALIDEKVLTASATNITFASIPQNFRSLIVIVEARTDAVAEVDGIGMRFNGDFGNNYDYIFVIHQSTGSTVTATRATSFISIGTAEAANSRANNFSPFSALIPMYTLTDREKWAECSNSGAFGNVSADADLFLIIRRGRWRNTAAIAAVTITPVTGTNFVSGSRATLYGLL